MKDATGNELHEGDLVMLVMPTNVVRARILKLKDGFVPRLSRLQPHNPTQAPPQIKPDEMQFAFTIETELPDAMPGDRHPLVMRVVDGDKERIVPIGD